MSRIAFLATSPMSMIMPIIENRLNVLPVSIKAPKAPTSATGSANMMDSGSSQDS